MFDDCINYILYKCFLNIWILHNHPYSLYEGFYDVFGKTIMIKDLNILKKIMVTDFDHFVDRRTFPVPDTCDNAIFAKFLNMATGNDWKTLRSAVSPTFAQKKVKIMSKLIHGCLKQLSKVLSKKAKHNDAVDMKKIFIETTTDAIAASIFGLNSKCLQGDTSFSQRLHKITQLNWRILLILFCPRLASLLKVGIFSPGAVEFFQGVVEAAVDGRKNENKTGTDFIQQLIDVSEHSGYVSVRADDEAMINHSVNIKESKFV